MEKIIALQNFELFFMNSVSDISTIEMYNKPKKSLQKVFTFMKKEFRSSCVVSLLSNILLIKFHESKTPSIYRQNRKTKEYQIFELFHMLLN